MIRSETLNKLVIFFLFATACDPAKDLESNVSKLQVEQDHWGGVVGQVPWLGVSESSLDAVARHDRVRFIDDLFHLVVKDLSVSELPESYWEHHEWHILAQVEGHEGHLLIERRRFSVIVAY